MAGSSSLHLQSAGPDRLRMTAVAVGLRKPALSGVGLCPQSRDRRAISVPRRRRTYSASGSALRADRPKSHLRQAELCPAADSS